MVNIIDCKTLSIKIKKEIKEKIDRTREEYKSRKPCLAVIVGGDPASNVYVKGKIKDCEEVGIDSIVYRYDDTTVTEESIISAIKTYNASYSIDGIIVQLPLPPHIDAKKVIETIEPSKDVDGFHPINAGKLFIGDKNTFVPCTALGIIDIIKSIGYDDLAGYKVVIIGRSNLVGKPTAKLLTDMNATVTLCHSRTKNIINETKTADILIVAAGVPNLVSEDWVKKGAIVIDVGMNRTTNGKLCGDVDDSVKNKAKYITTVPGGVGLLTRVELLKNTVKSYSTDILFKFI